MIIHNKKIGINYKPFIIAELSGNHSGSLKKALRLIKSAKKAGVDAIKIQTYTPDDLTLDENKKDFIINNKQSPWHNKKLYNLYKKAHTPLDWHKKIFSYAKELKLICFTSVFSEKRIKFLEKIGCPAYKIASFENNHYPLIKAVLKTNKPVIISTGMMSLKEINKLAIFLKKYRKRNIALLKCTSSYPSSLEESNVNTISHLRKKYKNFEIGLSDHTLGLAASCAAVSLGASIIEKHFVLNKKDKTVDSSFSITPEEMKKLVNLTNEVHASLGKLNFKQSKNEINNKNLKRSIYVIKDIKKYEKFTKKNLGIIRPGYGLDTKYFDKVLGKKAI